MVPFLGWLGRTDVEGKTEGDSVCRMSFRVSLELAEVAWCRETEGKWGKVEGLILWATSCVPRFLTRGWS